MSMTKAGAFKAGDIIDVKDRLYQGRGSILRFRDHFNGRSIAADLLCEDGNMRTFIIELVAKWNPAKLAATFADKEQQ